MMNSLRNVFEAEAELFEAEAELDHHVETLCLFLMTACNRQKLTAISAAGKAETTHEDTSLSRIIVSVLIIVDFSITISGQSQPRTRNNSSTVEGKVTLSLKENLARNGLGGATATDIRADESLLAVLAKISEMTNASTQQYGTGMNQTGSGVYGTLN